MKKLEERYIKITLKNNIFSKINGEINEEQIYNKSYKE